MRATPTSRFSSTPGPMAGKHERMIYAPKGASALGPHPSVEQAAVAPAPIRDGSGR